MTESRLLTTEEVGVKLEGELWEIAKKIINKQDAKTSVYYEEQVERAYKAGVEEGRKQILEHIVPPAELQSELERWGL